MLRCFKLLILLLVAIVPTGCGLNQLAVPAIDPSGEHIFAPGHATTTLVSPLPPNVHAPTPVWTTPPQPQACGYAPAADNSGHLCSLCAALGAKQSMPNIPGTEPRVVLSPARLVAPVGSEVILAAGVSSPTGKSELGVPMEWLLSQDSVGSFVSLADETRPIQHCRVIHGEPPHKVTNNYALGRTSSKEQLLTRGTRSPVDDLLLPAGQAWITVTSASEGVSNVTAYAPQTDAWERRQQTAQIYWIDAQWMFPPPAVARSGQKVPLTTGVMRHRTPTPIAGWSVIYEIAGGTPAGFDAQGTQSIEIPTDGGGNATAQLFPVSTQSGVTQVRIQIVRPAAANGALPRLVVGTGQTTVTWSAPGLAVQIVGGDTVDLGGVVNYRIEVRNPGDMVTKGVVVSDELPVGLTYVGGGNPAPAVFGNRLEWNIGDLLPHSLYPLQLTCKADQAGKVTHTVKARSADGLAAESFTSAQIQMPALGLELTGPDSAATGSEVKFLLRVVNRSQQKLTNVVISDQFDPGFRHAKGTSPIVRSLGDMNPGDSQQIGITFLVVGSGRLCHTVTVTADGGLTTTSQGCVNGVPGSGPIFSPGTGGTTIPSGPVAPGTSGPPSGATGSATAPGTAGTTPGGTTTAPVEQMKLEVTGPEQRTDGKTALFTIKLTNIGTTALQDVQVNVTSTAGLKILESGPEILKLPTSYMWKVGPLAAGAPPFIGQINAQCLAGGAAELQVRATAAGSKSVQNLASVRVLPAAGAAPSDTSADATDLSPGGAASGAGKLALTLSKIGDPVAKGGVVTYNLSVKNDRATDSDKRIAISISVPPELRISSVDAGPLQSHPDGNAPGTIVFDSLAELRPGETFNVKFEATGQQPGRFTVRAQATSFRQPTPATAAVETTVLAE